jgi:hypothetical protein
MIRPICFVLMHLGIEEAPEQMVRDVLAGVFGEVFKYA